MQNPNMLSNLSTGIISSGGAQNIKPFSNSNIFPDTGQWNRPRILQLGFKFER
jgi:hypothetical protein